MLAYLFILLAIAVHIRWVALPFSFTPVVAALLYFGARMPRKQMWIPLVMLAATGVYLSRVTYGYPFTVDLLIVWAWYAAMMLFGGKVIKGWSPLRIGAATLAGSVSFFLVSNFATWLVWNMYPKTFGGLMTCYVAGIPFFRNAVASDLFFSTAFFGIGYLVSQRAEGREAAAISRL
jgi:hypothetical protein